MVQIDPYLVALVGGIISVLLLVIGVLAKIIRKRDQQDLETIEVALADLKESVVTKEDCKGCHEGFDSKLAEGTNMFADITDQLGDLQKSMKSVVAGFQSQLTIHLATTSAIVAICQSLNIDSSECEQVREFYEVLNKEHIAQTAQKAGGKG